MGLRFGGKTRMFQDLLPYVNNFIKIGYSVDLVYVRGSEIEKGSMIDVPPSSFEEPDVEGSIIGYMTTVCREKQHTIKSADHQAHHQIC